MTNQQMTEREQQAAFLDDLGALCLRYSMEFEMSYPSVLGCLEIQKLDIYESLMYSLAEFVEDDDDE